MFCPNCGKQIPQNSRFCPGCGSPVPTQADIPQQAQYVPQNVQYTEPQPINEGYTPRPEQVYYTDQAPYIAPSVSPNRKKGLIIGFSVAAGVLVLAAAIIFIIIFAGGRSKESVACAYAEAIYMNDIKAYSEYNLVPKTKLIEMGVELYFAGDWDDFFDMVSDEYDHEIDSMSEYYAAAKDLRDREIEYKYGRYRLSAEVIDIDRLSRDEIEDELDDYISDLKDYYEINPLKYFDKLAINEAYQIEVALEINGEYDSDRTTYSLTVVNYKGSWKVLSW